jgi:DNA-binding beta-propeller fold protein YncE
MPNGEFVYLANYYGDYVLVARTSDNTVVDTLQFGTQTDYTAVDPNRNEVYVGCPDEDQIWVVGYGTRIGP